MRPVLSWLFSAIAAAAAVCAGAAASACERLDADPAALEFLRTSAPEGEAFRRVALVAGVAAYGGGVAPLKNPLNDADAIADMLRGLGFAVFKSLDPTAAALSRCAAAAGEASDGAAVSLVYFSCHGVQFGDRNFLIAVDARVGEDAAGRVAADQLFESATRGAATSIILLDACRENPFQPGGSIGLSPSLARGLSPIGAAPSDDEAPAQNPNTVIVYAAAPNSLALDGEGDLSPFAAALTEHLPTPGRPLAQVMRAVTNAVGEETDWFQTPWMRSSLRQEVTFAGAMTLKEAQIASDEFASRASELSNQGRRSNALAEALRGLPPDIPQDRAALLFADTYTTLTGIYFGPSVRLDTTRYSNISMTAPPAGVALSPDWRSFAIAVASGSNRMKAAAHRTDGSLIAELFDESVASDPAFHSMTPAHLRHPVALRLLLPDLVENRIWFRILELPSLEIGEEFHAQAIGVTTFQNLSGGLGGLIPVPFQSFFDFLPVGGASVIDLAEAALDDETRRQVERERVRVWPTELEDR